MRKFLVVTALFLSLSALLLPSCETPTQTSSVDTLVVVNYDTTRSYDTVYVYDTTCCCTTCASSDTIRDILGGATLRFNNSMQKVLLGGDTMVYWIRNIAALDTVWNEIVEFDGYTASLPVVVYSYPYVVSGEISSDSGTTWSAAQWDIASHLMISQSNTVTLSF